MKKILVIDDEQWLREMMQLALRQRGFEIVEAENGEKGIEVARKELPDLILCDVNMEKVDGYLTLSSLRGEPSTASIPFILMTGLADHAGMRHGMELGADDYLPKPFAIAELRARVGALMRRRSLPTQITLTVGSVRVDRSRRSVEVRGGMVELTGKEYALLEYLLLNRGRLVTRQEIAEHVWDDHFDPFSNLIEVYVGRLRQKIDLPGVNRGGSFLTTRRGEGYVVEDLPPETA
jgi:two-component system copper resistance phosphate regulon response regulator CusR